MTVGERIKILREQLGMSQIDFATKLNVSKQNLYKYENNIITNIPSDKIEAAAKLCNVSPAYLMGWEDEEKIANSLYALTVSPKLQQLVDIVTGMNPEQIDKVIDYAEFIKSKEEDA